MLTRFSWMSAGRSFEEISRDRRRIHPGGVGEESIATRRKRRNRRGGHLGHMGDLGGRGETGTDV